MFAQSFKKISAIYSSILLSDACINIMMSSSGSILLIIALKLFHDSNTAIIWRQDMITDDTNGDVSFDISDLCFVNRTKTFHGMVDC